jgi:hypothetical protein
LTVNLEPGTLLRCEQAHLTPQQPHIENHRFFASYKLVAELLANKITGFEARVLTLSRVH